MKTDLGGNPIGFVDNIGDNDSIFFMHKRSKTIRNFKFKGLAITKLSENWLEGM